MPLTFTFVRWKGYWTNPSRSNLGIHLSPATCRKNLGSGTPSPAASRFLAFSRCLSSTAVLAAVAPCISPFLIASVKFAHNLKVISQAALSSLKYRGKRLAYLLDSFSSCSDSGKTLLGTFFCVLASNTTLLPFFLSWYSITSFQCPEMSPTW